MKTDSIFYRLFQSVPQLLFELLNQPADHTPRYQFTSWRLCHRGVDRPQY